MDKIAVVPFHICVEQQNRDSLYMEWYDKLLSKEERIAIRESKYNLCSACFTLIENASIREKIIIMEYIVDHKEDFSLSNCPVLAIRKII